MVEFENVIHISWTTS